jgi:hypothetical protein
VAAEADVEMRRAVRRRKPGELLEVPESGLKVSGPKGLPGFSARLATSAQIGIRDAGRAG